jgi:hypothetical protein
MEMRNFSFMFDPQWSTAAHKLPSKVASLLLDSYYHLPDRPDLAFLCLWMAFNSSFSQIAVRESYLTNKSNLSDDFGLDCAAEAITNNANMGIVIDGSNRTLLDFLLLAMKVIPQKLTSMIATNAVRSIAFKLHQCGGRYESKAFNGLKGNFPILGQLIIDCHGSAYSHIVSPFIGIKNREIDLISNDPKRSQNIIRSLSQVFQDLFRTGNSTMRSHNSTQVSALTLTESERISLLLRYVLYASRNNLSHGKVSSRLNSDTANPESYKSNIYLYIVCYAFLSILFVNLGHASNIVIRQAMQNLKLILPKPVSTY